MELVCFVRQIPKYSLKNCKLCPRRAGSRARIDDDLYCSSGADDHAQHTACFAGAPAGLPLPRVLPRRLRTVTTNGYTILPTVTIFHIACAASIINVRSSPKSVSREVAELSCHPYQLASQALHIPIIQTYFR